MTSPDSESGVEAAYLGPIASFSNQAALSYFGPAAQLTPKVFFADVFSAVQSQLKPASQPETQFPTSRLGKESPPPTTVYGVVPIENSTNGSVVQTLDLLADRSTQYPDLFVCGELYLTVRHCLLVAKSSKTQPDVHRISRIQKLYTHPQAWGQCELFLSKHFKGMERQDTSSTSRAAELVAQEGEEAVGAAIGSGLCADAYGLDVLVEGIEDRGDNVTRFFILKKGKEIEGHLAGLGGRGDKWKSLLTFTIEHTAPGALVEALMVFRTNGLNLTSINSRPSREQPWHYIFLVECEGRSEGQGNGRVDRAIEELRRATKSCRFWGSWKDELS
jgi:prephenate dehydratase